MVATSAFGMGINSNDICIVIYMKVPMSMSIYIKFNSIYIYYISNDIYIL